jgi:hypothetical protein
VDRIAINSAANRFVLDETTDGARSERSTRISSAWPDWPPDGIQVSAASVRSGSEGYPNSLLGSPGSDFASLNELLAPAGGLTTSGLDSRTVIGSTPGRDILTAPQSENFLASLFHVSNNGDPLPAIPLGQKTIAAIDFTGGLFGPEQFPVLKPNSGQVAKALDQLPLSFDANQGQADPQVQFMAAGNGYTVSLTGSEAIFGLGSNQTAGESVVHMRVVDSNSAIRGIGLEPLPGTVNYFRGNDPNQWRTDIATFSRVEYPNVYPGINLVFYGSQQQLEYDFDVAPGADPSIISLDFAGAGDVTIDSAGNLDLATPSGTIQQQKPVLYQEVNGVRQEVTGGYVSRGPGQVHFQVGAYDPALPLVIDPVLAYSTYLGGSVIDNGYGIALDNDGNVYLTGQTSSADFPISNSAFQPVFGGFQNAFVTKLDPTCTTILYSTFIGGSHADRATGIAVDGDGNAYITGRTMSTDFLVTPGAFSTNYQGGDTDAFVSKLAPGGDSLVYSTYLGGEGNDNGIAIAVDGAGDAFVAGGTGSDGFPTTQSAYQYAPYGTDAFMTEFDPSGSHLLYSTRLGGSFSNERANAIALDANGNVYIAGQTTSPDFPTWNAFQDTFGGGISNAFVAEFDPTQFGDASLIFSTYLGGSGDDRGLGITVAADGAVYVTGETSSPDFPTLNALQPTYGGGDYNSFVAKFDAAGTLIYSTYLGGSGSDGGTGITTDADGNAYLTGFTRSQDFPTMNAFQPTLGGGYDAFVAKLDPEGTQLIFSSYLGGSGDENANRTDTHSGAIAVDGAGGIYLFGTTSSGDFPTLNALQPTLKGVDNAFLAKIT